MIKCKIKVLIVDDSLLVREMLAKGIAKDQEIEVVGTAPDPYVARDKILELNPDVVTLDVEMPKMNGIEFLKKLIPQYPIPVVVVSAISNNVFDALNAGAVDFVTKSTVNNASGMQNFIDELIKKIKIASNAKIGQANKNDEQVLFKNARMDTKYKIIAIGASTGGTEATETILKSLPKDIPGIVVVQHMPPVFTRMYADRLNGSCAVEVKEAQNGDRIYQGRVLIAPGDQHMVVKKNGNFYFVECLAGDKVSGHCPSIDVLFNSVAETTNGNAIGVILTGMGSDGARGLLKMRYEGCTTIGQDEESSIVYGMPKVALELGAVEKQVSLRNISNTLLNILSLG